MEDPAQADHAAPGLARRRAAVVARALPVLFNVWTAVLVVAGFTAAGGLPWFRMPGAPPAPALVGLGLYLAVAWWCRPTGAVGPRNALLAAALLGVYLSCRVAPLGDYGLNWMLARDTRLPFSEPGAVLIAGTLYKSLGAGALELVAPLIGACVVWGLLAVGERWFVAGHEDARFRRRALALLLFGWGHHLAFFRGNIEHTQFAVPFAVLLVVRLADHVQGGGRRPLLVAAACLALACLCHGVSFFVLPALPIAVLVARAGRPGVWGDLGRAAGVVVIIAGAAVLLFVALGFELEPAFLSHGLADMLIGFTHARSPTGHLLTWGHHRFVAGIVLAAAPAVCLLALAGPMSLARRYAAWRPRWWLALPALGYLGFLTLFEIRLGMPRDHDLVFALSFTLVLAVLDVVLAVVAGRRLLQRGCVVLLIGAGVLNWWTVGPLLTGPFAAPVAPEPHRGGLAVQGVVADDLAPKTVTVARAGGLALELSGPPRCEYLVLVGPGGRWSRTWRHIGTARAATPPDFADMRTIWYAVLDGEGRATKRVALDGFAVGETIYLQGMIHQPWGDPLPRVFTPALRVEIR